MPDLTPRPTAEGVLRCDSCNALLDRERIDLDRGVATCPYCRAVMRIGRRAVPEPGVLERPRIALPSRFQVEDLGGELSIRFRWFSWVALFLVPFTLVWCGFLVVWYAVGASMDAPVVFMLFPLIHVAVGVGLFYFCAALFVNSTTIRVRDGELTVAHGPLPWYGGGRYPSHDVEQLYCQEKVSHSKNGTSVTYELNAQFKGVGKKTLLRGLPDGDQALFLEQQLETHLKIDDKPVAGELRR